MPGPANDNFANATALGGYAGAASGSNIGATGEAGEPANAGKTVWWVWSPPVAETGGGRYVFGTRYRPGVGLPETSIATVINVYRGTTLAGLVQVGAATTYAGWERQGEVTFDADPSHTYYIRVDGIAGAEGNILLWWEPATQLEPGDCSGCPPGNSFGRTCVGNWNPDISREGTMVFSGVPAGVYELAYCRGSWNYRDGWVVSRVPQSALQTWPLGDLSGYFFYAEYSNNGIQHAGLPEPVPPGVGYGNRFLAEDAAKCSRLVFRHDAAAPIKLRFTDNAFGDNVPAPYDSTPTYVLNKIAMAFKAKTATFFLDSPGVYDSSFLFDNLSDITWTSVSATLALTGGIVACSNCPLTGITINANQVNKAVGFVFTVSPSSKLDVMATILFSDAFGNSAAIVYDLTPRITITFGRVTTGTLAGARRWIITFNIKCDGLPTLALVVTPRLTGGVSDLRDWSSGAPISSIAVGAVSSNISTFSLAFTPTPVGLTGVTFTFDLADATAGLSFPPAVIAASVPI
jgi:hypothetical protein